MLDKERGCISKQYSCPYTDSAISSCSNVYCQDSIYSDDELTETSYDTHPFFSPNVGVQKPRNKKVPMLHDLCVKLLGHVGSDEVLQSAAKLELETTGFLLHDGRQCLTVANQEDEEADEDEKGTQSDQDLHLRRDDKDVQTNNTTGYDELSMILDNSSWHTSLLNGENTIVMFTEKEALPHFPYIYTSSDSLNIFDDILREQLYSKQMCPDPISTTNKRPSCIAQKDFEYGKFIESEDSESGETEHLMADSSSNRPEGTCLLDVFSGFFVLSVLLSEETDTEQQYGEQSALLHSHSPHDQLEHHGHSHLNTEQEEQGQLTLCSSYKQKESEPQQLEAPHDMSSSEQSDALCVHDGLGTSVEDYTYRQVDDDRSTDDNLATRLRHTPTQCEGDENSYRAEIAVLQYPHNANGNSNALNALKRQETAVACHEMACKRTSNMKDEELSSTDANASVICQAATDKNTEGDHSVYKECQISHSEEKPGHADTKPLSKKDVPYRCVVVDMEVGANRLVRPRNKQTIVHTTHPHAPKPAEYTTDQKLKIDEKPEQSYSEPSQFCASHEKEETDRYNDKEESNPLTRHFNRFQLSPEFRELIVSMMGESTGEGGQRHLENEWTRLATFDQCRVPPGVYIVPVAANGFFVDTRHENSSELRVQCAFCAVRVPLREFRGREPREVHSRVSPGCRFLQGGSVGNVTISDTVFSSAARFMATYPTPSLHGDESVPTNQSTTTHTLSPPEIIVTDSSAVSLTDAQTVEDAVSGESVPGAFSALPNQSRAFSALLNQSRAFSALPSQSGAFSAPTSQSGAFSAPTSQSGAFSAPTSQSGAFSAPPSQSGAFSALPNQPGASSTPQNQSSEVTSTAQFEESGGSARFQPSPSETTSNTGNQGSGRNVTPASEAQGSNSEVERMEESGRDPSDVGRSGEGSSSSPENGQERQVVTYEDLGIFAQAPKRPDMAVTQIRINTFTNWPHESTHPAARMAEAGFYFTGHTDLVRCFHCKGGLKTWESSDQPWVEHSRWFPRCHFVRLAKGQKFVDVVQRLNDPQTRPTISEQQVLLGVQQLEQEERRGRADPSLITTRPAIAPITPVNPYVEAMRRVGLRQGTEISITDETMQEMSERLEEDNNVLRNERLCKVCQIEQVNILFLPCGHLVACAQCAPALRTCAICRQAVKGSVRVLLDDILDDPENMEEGEPRERTDHATGSV